MTTRPCGHDGCPRPHYAHGYCRSHARQWMRHGRTWTIRPTTRRPPADKFPPGWDAPLVKPRTMRGSFHGDLGPLVPSTPEELAVVADLLKAYGQFEALAEMVGVA